MKIGVIDNNTNFGIKKFPTAEEYAKLPYKKMKFVKITPDDAEKITEFMKKISWRIKLEQARAWQAAKDIIINKGKK